MVMHNDNIVSLVQKKELCFYFLDLIWTLRGLVIVTLDFGWTVFQQDNFVIYSD